MNRTKLVGILMVVSAVLNIAIDILNGGGVDFARHYDTLSTALAGAGLFYLREGVKHEVQTLKVEGVK